MKIESDGRVLSLELPWDAGTDEMMTAFVTMMTWLTFPQAVTENGMANYLEERGWQLDRRRGSDEDEDDDEEGGDE